MKTTEETKEHAGFVRDVIAAAQIDFPTDHEREYREALFRAAFARVEEFEITHLRRMSEALCAMDFASDWTLALRQAVLDRIAKHHKLREYRSVKLPPIVRPKKEVAK